MTPSRCRRRRPGDGPRPTGRCRCGGFRQRRGRPSAAGPGRPGQEEHAASLRRPLRRAADEGPATRRRPPGRPPPATASCAGRGAGPDEVPPPGGESRRPGEVPGDPIALAASGIILLLLSSSPSGERERRVDRMAIGSAAVGLMVSAAWPPRSPRSSAGRATGFAGILIGTSLVCGIGPFGVPSGERRGGEAGRERPPGPRARSRSGRTFMRSRRPPAGCGRPSPRSPRRTSSSPTSGARPLFIVIVVEKRDFEEVPTLEEYALQLRENFLQGTPGGHMIWGPTRSPARDCRDPLRDLRRSIRDCAWRAAWRSSPGRRPSSMSLPWVRHRESPPGGGHRQDGRLDPEK